MNRDKQAESAGAASTLPLHFPVWPLVVSDDLVRWCGAIEEARRKFEEIRSWLLLLGDVEMQRLIGCARHFHPGPRSMAGDAPARELYLQMERGQYDIETIKRVAPNIAIDMPKRVRGLPWEYRFAVLAVSGMLAAYEWTQICLVTSGVSQVKVLPEHLYCLERFACLWFRVAEHTPPSMWFAKQAKASDWRSELRLFSLDYSNRNPTASLSACSDAFLASRAGSGLPKKDCVYRALLRMKKLDRLKNTV